MGRFESNYLDDIEKKYEDENREREVEKSISGSSLKKKKEEVVDIEEAVLSSIGVLDELWSLGEDVEDAIKEIFESRCKVIKKLKQDGKLNGISDRFKDIINAYIEKYDEKQEKMER